MSLVCECVNSKHVDFVTVADLDDEECLGNIVVEILTLKIVQVIEAKILKLELNRYFEAEVWSRFFG